MAQSALEEGSALVLAGGQFPRRLNLSRRELPEIDARGAQFQWGVDFSGSIFHGPASFSRAVFRQEARFSEVTIRGNASFGNSACEGHFFMGGSRIHGDADFTGAKVALRFMAPETTFVELAIFRHAEIMGGAELPYCQFSSWADFRDVRIGYLALFNQSTFQKLVDFGSAPALSNAQESCEWHLEATDFQEGVSFENRCFSGVTNFRKARFGRAPLFHGSSLHQDTDFGEAIFADVRSRGAPRAYRTLKLAMENLRARNEEADFYALEQRSLRNQLDTPRTVKLLSWLYDETSDYGRSFWRPAVWLAGVGILAFLVYVQVAAVFPPEGGYSYGDLMELTVRQAIRPLDAWTRDGSAFARQTVSNDSTGTARAIRLVAALQSVASLALVALALLAIRWRFRRG
ncbi:MAG: pentapeptide repeat-containing protein [Myxococcota bacterium]